MVWEIVCRWHAMKLLFDLYCDPLIRESYMRSAILDESHGVENALMSEDFIPNPSITCSKMNQIRATQTQKAYQRFYQALTAHWVATETLCIARGAVYETSNEYLECFDYVWDLRINNPGRSLVEKLDILEVVDFVWGFLGRKIFQGENAISDWVDQDYLEQSDPASPEWNWLFFVLQITQYLRPPHIIELLLLLTWVQPQACDIGNKSKYLSDLGFSLDASEVRSRDAGANSPETFVPVHMVDEDVVNSLTQHWGSGSRFDVRDRWERYRKGRWNSDAKGKLLFDELSSVQWVERIEKA